jgi:hypothetical protein
MNFFFHKRRGRWQASEGASELEGGKDIHLATSCTNKRILGSVFPFGLEIIIHMKERRAGPGRGRKEISLNLLLSPRRALESCIN